MGHKKKLLTIANSLPKSPGCYLMKNQEDKVIYVGKAKNLKARVSSYFNEGVKTPKTEILVSHIRDFEFMITDNEAEAFVLENNLIKKYTPKYNISMRDDKSYPYVQINTNEPYPRLEYVRNPKRKKGMHIFGPFVVGSQISEVMRILTKSFELRDCNLREFQSRKRPCLLYQIKQCSAPCVDYIKEPDYLASLDVVTKFLKGNEKGALKFLENKMYEAAEKEFFESAAFLRDSIEVLKNFTQFGQKHADLGKDESDLDFISYYVGDIEIDISVYMIRRGILIGHKNFSFPAIDALNEIEDEVMIYLLQYYSSTMETLPKKIIPSFSNDRIQVFQEALSKSIKNKIQISKPTKKHESFLTLAYDHAKETQRVRFENQDSVFVGLNKLKDLLGLKERPKILECYDVAIWQGKSPTASQVVFEEGRPNKKKYRYYHMQERPEGNNDFAMMRELLERRLDNGDLPDVIIVDGGVQQVNTLRAVLEENNVHIPVAGIAKARNLKGIAGFKEKSVSHSDERLIIPGRSNPYTLAKSPSLMRICVSMRDEAHRFSRKLHHKAEKKRTFASPFEEIEGIGPKTREKIQKYLLSYEGDLNNLTVDDLKEELKIKEDLCDQILQVILKINSKYE